MWEITPESVYPQTRVEDYLADCYRAGWVVFETLDGSEKRRLCPPPYAWQDHGERDLEAWLERAEIVLPRGIMREGPAPVPADLPPTVPPHLAAQVPRHATGDIDTSYLGVVRSFQYPGGGVWTVGVVRQPEGGEKVVLRFVSGVRAIHLAAWPKEWIDLSDASLVELLRRASSRERTWTEGMPRRRYDDPRPGMGEGSDVLRRQ
jgi:hypothetical protein